MVRVICPFNGISVILRRYRCVSVCERPPINKFFRKHGIVLCIKIFHDFVLGDGVLDKHEFASGSWIATGM